MKIFIDSFHTKMSQPPKSSKQINITFGFLTSHYIAITECHKERKCDITFGYVVREKEVVKEKVLQLLSCLAGSILYIIAYPLKIKSNLADRSLALEHLKYIRR